jgi:hypothetical protein
MLKTLALFTLLSSLTMSAQVQLGGHVYVPSSTDSTNGLAIVNFTANGNCDIVAQTNCLVTNASGGPFDVSLPYTGTLIVNDPGNVLTGNNRVFLPNSPGREYNIENNTNVNIFFGGNGGDVVDILTDSAAQIWNDTFGYSTVSCTGIVGFLPAFSGLGIGCANSNIDDGVTNNGFLTAATGMVFSYRGIDGSGPEQSYIGFDNSPNGGQSDTFLDANIKSVNPTTGVGTLVNPALAAAAISFTTPAINTSQPACVKLWAGSENGNATLNKVASFCDGQITLNFPLATLGGASGFATLAAGTVVVPTTAACTPSATCVYQATNCGPNGSAAIGTPSVAASGVTVGTSFTINSLTGLAAIAVDSSLVCWKIN